MPQFADSATNEFEKLVAIYAPLIIFNVLVWIGAFILFANSPALLGTALLAYLFGLRHAVDADHIAAIDNVVRKLMQDGKRPLTVGLFFSLGHSTVVVFATILVALGTTALQSSLNAIKELCGLIGTSISAFFLLAIAAINLTIFFGVWTSFQRVRRGASLHRDELDTLLAGHGILARVLRPLFRVISKPWHMYPLGFLFGLGFDTATEIGLLGISATQTSQGMSPLAILIFPALFTAAMALVDTSDGVLMVGAYGWAFIKPIRKLWYNLTITAVSVLVALLIGVIETLGLLAEKFNLTGKFWTAVTALNEDLASFGFMIIGVSIACWIGSMLVYRWSGYDELVPNN